MVESVKARAATPELFLPRSPEKGLWDGPLRGREGPPAIVPLLIINMLNVLGTLKHIASLNLPKDPRGRSSQVINAMGG